MRQGFVAAILLFAVAVAAPKPAVGSPATGPRVVRASISRTSDLAAPADPCQVRVGKSAQPDRILGGETSRLVLTASAVCPAIDRPARVALMFDNSVSVGGPRIRYMQDAVDAFVASLDFARDRVGLGSYHARAEVLAPLTSDPEAVRAASRRFFPRSGADLGTAVRAGHQLLVADRDVSPADDAVEVLLLFVGSRNDGDPALLETALDEVRRDGVLVMTVACTGQADIDALRRMASDPTFAYLESDGERYAPLMSRAARDMRSTSVLAAEIADQLPTGIEYVWGSGDPAPRIRDRELRWRYDPWPSAGVTVSFEVRLPGEGCHVVNERAELTLMLSRGNAQRQAFPLPTVCVLPPRTATPTSSPTSPGPVGTATPEATSPRATEPPPEAQLYLPTVLCASRSAP